MKPNYYHVTLNQSESFHYSTPENGEIIMIAGANVTKAEYPNGEELFQIINGDKVDIFASFPIELRKS